MSGAGETPAHKGVVDLMAALEESVRRARTARAQRRHDANVSLVTEAMKRWRLQNDPAANEGPTMAEFVVRVLAQEGRLR